ncbi:unnamed protein product [Allacma fusca]|uniref:NADH dehydrogenase [ubiquinone] iron-sulfur protein 6, mitochondrial n=1 Tax=Allacma fusca TaxID=39272 RepID=A0A8J2LQ76_9HEXA|nr:unnamed protein product [Allacma fusca]
MALTTKLISAGRIIAQNLTKSQNARRMVSVTSQCSSKKDWEPEEVKTHTGQVYDDNDYRRVRFINKTKQVNTRFAIDLINEVPPEEKEDRVVWCDGGSGPTGHPRVYINLDQPGNHTCGYCGLRFYKDDHHH